MPDHYRIHLSHQAADQMQSVFQYIAQDTPDNASRMIEKILEAIDALEILPHRYKVVKNVGRAEEEVRSMPVGAYLVRYHVNDSRRIVTVLTIRHGARRPED